jgi:hypothetical protein
MTSKQRKAMHLYFEMLAEELNNTEYDVKAFMEKVDYQIDVPWTKAFIKEQIWKPIQFAILQKESTEDMTNSEVDKVYEVVNERIAAAMGVYVPFPTEENNA